MHCHQIVEWGKPLEVRDYPNPKPEGTEVLVKVEAAGVCHSDIHIRQGYFDLGGEMSVIGIISVSLKFHLALGYYKSNGKSEVKGQATLTVEIEILFFSASVSVSCERRLGGSDADPLFVDFYPAQQVWTEYADAFAA